MAISNFIYDEISLKDFDNGNYMIGFFSSDYDVEEVQQNINKTSLYMGREQPFVYINYEETLSFTIGIIKNPCKKDAVDEITWMEMEQLKRWLCRPAPHKFKLDDPKYEDIFWEGTFEVKEVVTGSKRTGVELTFISTRPFALQEDVIFTGELLADEQLTINDTSMEIGYIYPQITVKCLEDGDLSIYNDFDERETIIKNCKANEVITIDKNLQISSTFETHKIADDFNYTYYRINNSFNSTANSLTSNLAISYEIRYSPIAKAVIV